MPKKSNATKTTPVIKRKTTRAKPKALRTKPSSTRRRSTRKKVKQPPRKIPKSLYTTQQKTPMIESMITRNSKYSALTTWGANGVEIKINGKNVNLGIAPTNERGNIGVFDLCGDIVRIDGIPFFHCETGEYFPEAPVHDTPRGNDFARISESIARVMRGSIDSIGVVGPGCITNIF